MVAAESAPDFAALRDGIAASPMGAAFASESLVAEKRTIAGLLGEELRFCVAEDEHVRLHAMWRYPGAARDLLRPEIEVEYSSGLGEREDCELEWLSIIQSLALSGGGL